MFVIKLGAALEGGASGGEVKKFQKLTTRDGGSFI